MVLLGEEVLATFILLLTVRFISPRGAYIAVVRLLLNLIKQFSHYF